MFWQKQRQAKERAAAQQSFAEIVLFQQTKMAHRDTLDTLLVFAKHFLHPFAVSHLFAARQQTGVRRKERVLKKQTNCVMGSAGCGLPMGLVQR